jgi:hypothetical protein
MKTVSLIILMLCLLQPLASLGHPCASSLNNQGTADSSGHSKAVPLHLDADITDCSDCCDDTIFLKPYITAIDMLLVTLVIMPGRNTKLCKIVIPIFVPPQNLV